MARTDVFALQNSALNPFLFADVGVEMNGSALTILSVLARLGRDPWAQAAAWARLPRAAVVDALADCIARMPLSRQAVANARLTATQLALLLPREMPTSEILTPKPGGISIGTPRGVFQQLPKWFPVAIIYLVFAMGMSFSMMLIQRRRPEQMPVAATITAPRGDHRPAMRPAATSATDKED